MVKMTELYGVDVPLFTPEELDGTVVDVMVLVRVQTFTGEDLEEKVMYTNTKQTGPLMQCAITEEAHRLARSDFE